MPTSALGVLVFILAVAPGFLYELERRHRFTRAQESAFYEVSRSLVASVLIGIPAAGASFLLWWLLAPTDPPDITAILKRDPQYLGAHTGLVVLSLLAYMAVGVGIVGTVRVVRKGNIKTAHSIWLEIFREHTPSGHEPFAKVKMKTGAVWLGKVGTYSTEHEVTHRELVLHSPILYAESLASTYAKMHEASTILKAADIESIAVAYAAKDPKPTNSNAAPPLREPHYGAPFRDALQRFFKKYAVFTGRASRSEYWWWVLFNGVVGITFALLFWTGLTGFGDSGTQLNAGPVGVLGLVVLAMWSLAVFIPSLALMARRLHDVNLSAWTLLIGLIPFLGGFALGVIMLLAPNADGQRFDKAA